MEAKRLGFSTLSKSLDHFSSTFVKNAFKPLASLASPLTTGTTSSQAQENEWVSPPVPVMLSSLPPSNAALIYGVKSIRLTFIGQVDETFRNTCMTVMVEF